MPKYDVSTQDIVVMYVEKHLTLREIAKLTGMSHVNVSKRLKKAGITAKDGTWVKTNCAFCGKDIEIRRARVKFRNKDGSRRRGHFCNLACYIASLENPGYKPWRHGQRLARAIVGQYYILQEGNVVHHVDGDERNNNLDNLMVFKNQAEHMRYHRGGKVTPLWDGRALFEALSAKSGIQVA